MFEHPHVWYDLRPPGGLVDLIVNRLCYEVSRHEDPGDDWVWQDWLYWVRKGLRYIKYAEIPDN